MIADRSLLCSLWGATLATLVRPVEDKQTAERASGAAYPDEGEGRRRGGRVLLGDQSDPAREERLDGVHGFEGALVAGDERVAERLRGRGHGTRHGEHGRVAL